MTDNLYQTPSTDVETNVPPVPRPKTGIAVAVVVDMVGTTLIGIIAGIIYAILATAKGATPEEIMKIGETITPLGGFGLILTLMGLLMSCIAGYLCARIAKVSVYKNVLIAAVIEYALSLLLTLGSERFVLSNSLNLLIFIVMPFGAWLYARKNII